MNRYLGFVAILLLIAVMLFIPTPASAQTVDTDLDSYVLFALDELSFKGGNEATYTRGHVLGGNVGVNGVDLTPGNSDALLSVGVNGLFVMSDGTQLVGDSIRLGEEASVWDVYRNHELGIGWGATNPKIGGPVIRNNKFDLTPPGGAPPPPVIDPDLLTPEALCGTFEAGTTDLIVEPSQQGTISPGSYALVNVKDGGTLRFTEAGTYTMARFKTGQTVKIYTVPGTIIRIAGDGDPNTTDFNLGGNGSYFGSEYSTVESVACICIISETTVQFSDNGEFWGVIKAPVATIKLGRGFTHYGRFVGQVIGSDFNDNVTYRECTREAPVEAVPSITGWGIVAAVIAMGAIMVLILRGRRAYQSR